jgi:uncharacterized protein YktA (UPF0223 family)
MSQQEKEIERYYETKLGDEMYKANQEIIAINEKLCDRDFELFQALDFIDSKGLMEEFKKFKEIKK